MSTPTNKSSRLCLTGLWAKTINGQLMLSGYLGNLQIEIWPNGYKTKGSNEPDYRVYLADKYKKEVAKGPKSRGVDNKSDENLPLSPPPTDWQDEQIPF